jgi:hyaluronate lyase
MARAVHRRAGWAFAISMNSNRIARYESINGDNLRGFHTGAGMTYLYDGDNTQYTDGFWPTVDPYRLAGTTVDRKPLADSAGQTMSPWKWAGGAALDAKYSAVGMSLQAAATNLLGKKSWFCFDELIFCMGRSISGGSGYAVETIVENRNLHQDGTNRLLVNGAEWTGSDQTLAGVAWAHIEGVGGYLFPASAGQSVRLQRTTRAGRWRDINTDGSTISLSRRYLTLAIQHGVNPADGLYSYLVVPKATPERTAQLSADRGVAVVGHNSKCHAVHQLGTGITMINFWDGPHTCPLTQHGGSVAVDKDCSVIVQERDGTLKIAVAEPLRSGSTVRVTVTPAQTGYRLARKEGNVTVITVGASIVLDVAVGVYGRSYSAEFTSVPAASGQ